jgi:hypothetical protein
MISKLHMLIRKQKSKELVCTALVEGEILQEREDDKGSTGGRVHPIDMQ